MLLPLHIYPDAFVENSSLLIAICKRMGNAYAGMAQAPAPAAGNGCQCQGEPPPPIRKLVALMVPFHCPNCALKVRRKLYDVEGVETVALDVENNRVTVTGTMDTAALVLEIYRKFRKRAQILLEKEERVREMRRWSRNRFPGDNIFFCEEERRCQEGACNCCAAYHGGLCDDDCCARAPHCRHGLDGFVCDAYPPHHAFAPPSQLYCFEEPKHYCAIM